MVPKVVLEGVFRDLWVPAPNHVFGLISDILPDIGTDVPSSEMVQLPVCFDRGDLAVVIVVAVVDCAG